MGLMPGIVVDPKGTHRALLNAAHSMTRSDKERRPAPADERTLSKEQEHLRRIRLELGLSQGEWARKLGVAPATIASYEYGRTKSVPPETYRLALKLEKGGAKLRKLHQGIGQLSMSDIVKAWAARMMVDPDDTLTLARFMDKEVSTILRWKSNSQRPDISALAKYDEHVTRKARELRKAHAGAILRTRRQLARKNT